ncbi:YegP family protein [Angustibacter sp. McL0619]|uniref:YegP family protein n=1 Tax=Angustibacter sp. McL0619 TaxID=3415676 RepID=UPI003CF1850A
MNQPRIEVFPGRTRISRRRQWYFRVVAGNGEIVAQSEGYTRPADAHLAAINLRDLIVGRVVKIVQVEQ